MDASYLLRGLIIGVAIAAPVGPIGVLCVRRTLSEGRATGFVSGLGAATADALYGCIAGFGLTFAANLLIAQHLWIRLFGSLFLCYLGVVTLLARPAERAAGAAAGKGLLGAYLTTFFLTLTNPMTILSFTAIFAGLGIVQANADYTAATALVLGVFGGSALWWLTLSSGVSLLRNRFTTRMMVWVNRGAGAVMLAFGIWYGLPLLTELGG